MSDVHEERCFSCGAVVPVIDGPTHAYMLSSPGCWSVFGEVLAREYGNPAYMANHRLTVDAYAVQHPGEPTRAAARSVLLHLVSLCAIREHGVPPARATRIVKELADGDLEAEWMDPPGDRGEVTVLDVHRAEGVEAHLKAVEKWAEASWEAWSAHHAVVRTRTEALIG